MELNHLQRAPRSAQPKWTSDNRWADTERPLIPLQERAEISFNGRENGLFYVGGRYGGVVLLSRDTTSNETGRPCLNEPFNVWEYEIKSYETLESTIEAR